MVTATAPAPSIPNTAPAPNLPRAPGANNAVSFKRPPGSIPNPKPLSPPSTLKPLPKPSSVPKKPGKPPVKKLPGPPLSTLNFLPPEAAMELGLIEPPPTSEAPPAPAWPPGSSVTFYNLSATIVDGFGSFRDFTYPGLGGTDTVLGPIVSIEVADDNRNGFEGKSRFIYTTTLNADGEPVQHISWAGGQSFRPHREVNVTFERADGKPDVGPNTQPTPGYQPFTPPIPQGNTRTAPAPAKPVEVPDYAPAPEPGIKPPGETEIVPFKRPPGSVPNPKPLRPEPKAPPLPGIPEKPKPPPSEAPQPDPPPTYTPQPPTQPTSPPETDPNRTPEPEKPKLPGLPQQPKPGFNPDPTPGINPDPTPAPKPPEETPSPTPTPEITPGVTPSPSPEITPGVEPVPAPGTLPSPNPQPDISPSPSPQPQPTPQPGINPAPTPAPMPGTTPAPGTLPSPTPSPSPSPSPTPSPSPSPGSTPTPSTQPSTAPNIPPPFNPIAPPAPATPSPAPSPSVKVPKPLPKPQIPPPTPQPLPQPATQPYFAPEPPPVDPCEIPLKDDEERIVIKWVNTTIPDVKAINTGGIWTSLRTTRTVSVMATENGSEIAKTQAEAEQRAITAEAAIAARNSSGINTGLNSTILANLTTLTSFLQKAWQKTRIQKVLDVLTFIGVMHNVALLSRDVGETFGWVAGQALNVVGIEDEEGNTIDVYGWFTSNIQSLLRAMLGDDLYEDARDTWLKASAIVRSASMIIWTMRGIMDATQDLMEWVAENTGKIGNALKAFGVVGRGAYPWMSEGAQARNRIRARISKVTGTLENVEDMASSFSMATGNILEIQDESGELINQFGEFRTTVLDAVPDPWDDNAPVKDAAEQGQTASQSPDIQSSDTARGN
ncbi:MAG: hypothetical protein AAF609_12600 [Cyanobacteria bacterium P01_C01_bin.120]